MVLQVAKTVYETTPDKTLAAVDVYAKTVSTEPVNSETKAPDALNQKALEGLNPNALTKLYTDFNKDFKDPTKSLTQALATLNSVIKNPKEFTQSLTKDILGDTLRSVGYKGTADDVVKMIKDGPNAQNILNIVGNSNADLKVIIGDVEKMVAGKDLSTVNGISALIGDLTGNDNLLKVLNISPQMSVVKSFIDQAMQLRLPAAVDLLVDSIESHNDRRDLRLYSTLNAANNSDLEFIDKQLDDPEIGAGAISGMFPTIVSTLLSNYVLINRTPTELEAAALITTLDKLDPNWLSYDRDGVMITNVSDLASATEDALSVLLKDDRTFIAANIARQMDTQNMTVATLAMRKYTPPAILNTK